MRSAVACCALLAGWALAPRIDAQEKGGWRRLGTTASGNEVAAETRSIKRTGNLVRATVRVVFTTPVQTPKGAWASSRTKATFDCAAKKLAASENAYYADVRGTRLVERTVNRIPGYGPALNGSMGEIAMTALCARPAR